MSLAQATVSMEACSQQLASLPVEIWCKIFSELDLETAIALSKTHNSLTRILKGNWASILYAILCRDFSPVDEFLRMNIDLITIPHVVFPLEKGLIRRIFFGKRLVWETPFARSGPLSIADFHFKLEHMARLVRTCRVLKQWELVFPRLRFARALPEERRSLLPREKERLREALYFWWSQTVVQQKHSETGTVCPRTVDKVEELPLTRLCAITDVWLTLEAAVLRDLLPSSIPTTEAKRLCSLYVTRDDYYTPLARKMMRLAPDDLLHYIDSYDSYHSHQHLVQDILLRCSSSPSGMDFFGVLLERTLNARLFKAKSDEDERRKFAIRQGCRSPVPIAWCALQARFPRPEGGILDNGFEDGILSSINATETNLGYT